jgi:hypothetical protein
MTDEPKNPPESPDTSPPESDEIRRAADTSPTDFRHDRPGLDGRDGKDPGPFTPTQAAGRTPFERNSRREEGATRTHHRGGEGEEGGGGRRGRAGRGRRGASGYRGRGGAAAGRQVARSRRPPEEPFAGRPRTRGQDRGGQGARRRREGGGGREVARRRARRGEAGGRQTRRARLGGRGRGRRPEAPRQEEGRRAEAGRVARSPARQAPARALRRSGRVRLHLRQPALDSRPGRPDHRNL